MEKSRLKETYFDKIIPGMVKEFNFSNIHQVPRITKVVLSMGLGGKKDIKKNVDDLTLIAGQKALVTKAKKSVSQFNVRTGHDSGAMVTLRDNNMYHFIDRLLNIALLNWRAFPGVLSKSINKQKFITISIGVPDKRIFSEIITDSLRSEGLNVTICTDARDTDQFKFLMKSLGFPMVG